ncbi:unnamed protein product [Polarella glacialis]|uniref:Helicase C-terminal domain-containing protein n=1 Tax=Polarella glacialis TaxID=89957 RepID=A0A813L6Q7_POLGL|nr:unnamed protein product [Polarella glacialis]
MQRVRALASEALTWPHLPDWQRLEWAAAVLLDAVPMKELPPWFLEQHNVSRRDIGVDLFSLDGSLAVQCKCYNGTVPSAQLRRFLRVSSWVFKASQFIVVTSNTSKLTQSSSDLLREKGASHQIVLDEDIKQLAEIATAQASLTQSLSLGGGVSAQASLRECQVACLKACEDGARIIEMACGSGKTRVLVLIPSHVLLGQFYDVFPSFCLVGTGHNDKIDWDADGFLAVYDSCHLLANMSFSDILVDEAHHPLPEMCPDAACMYKFSATHYVQPDFEYTMAQAIEDGVLCDYDAIIPIVSEGDTQACLAEMILKKIGIAAWHINGNTPVRARDLAISEFSGPLRKPAHVLVTVQVLGEGVNIPNADTCLFIEPRSSYVSIIQAMGRVLRHHPCKPLAHIILPAVTADYIPCSSTNFGPKRRAPVSRQPVRTGTTTTTTTTTTTSTTTTTTTPTTTTTSTTTTTTTPTTTTTTNHKQQQQQQASAHSSKLRPKKHYLPKLKGGELERFVLALSQADERMKEALVEGRNGRIRFIDARIGISDRSSPIPCIQSIQAHLHEIHRVLNVWECRLNELQAFLIREQRLPGQKSHDSYERHLGHWVKNQGSDVRRGLLSHQQLRKFNDSHPTARQLILKWLDPMACWQESCKYLAAFVKTHGRLPMPVDKYSSEAESLRRWLFRQQRQVATFTDEQLQMFKAVHPTIAQRVEEILDPGAVFARKGRELATFVREHGRLPLNSSECGGAYSLYAWLRTQRRNVRSLPPEQIAQLSESHGLIAQRLKKWSDPILHWRERLKDLAIFVTLNSRLPSFTKYNATEASLECWLRGIMRDRARLSSEKLELLQSAHPLIWGKVDSQIKRLSSYDCAYKRKCEQLAIFMQSENRLPCHGGKKGPEVQLAIWLSDQRSAFDKLTTTQRNALQEVHPKLADQVRRWGQPMLSFSSRCEALGEFVRQHGKLPRVSSAFVDEITLGEWLSNQKTRFEKNIMSESQWRLIRNAHPILADRADSWQTPLYKWHKKCEALGAFVTQHGHRPRAASTNRQERSFASWLNAQGQNLKEGRLTQDQASELKGCHEQIAARVDKWQRLFASPNI